MEDFKAISVKAGPNHRVQFHNPTGYSLIGLGDQGAVFLLDSDRCVKIYAKEKNARREAEVYKKCGHSFILPKLYEWGPNYLILEYIKGLPLDEYLREKAGIPFSLSIQIVYAVREMRRLGFTRLDIPMRHFLVTRQNAVKVIDHVNSFVSRSPKPSSLFKALKKMDLLELFLEHVSLIDKELYAEWNDKTMEDKMNG